MAILSVQIISVLLHFYTFCMNSIVWQLGYFKLDKKKLKFKHNEILCIKRDKVRIKLPFKSPVLV